MAFTDTVGPIIDSGVCHFRADKTASYGFTGLYLCEQYSTSYYLIQGEKKIWQMIFTHTTKSI
jgi:Zn-finger protein